MPASALGRCIGTTPEQFAAEHWSRRPLLSRAKELPTGFEDLLSQDDVDDLVTERALRTPFFRTVAQGSGLPDPVRTVTAGNRRIGDLVDPDRLFTQYADGATLVLMSLHRLHPPVAALCRQLAAELGHPIQCNAYLTPAGDAQGFAFHHDTHDVLVLQVSGRKRWIVHEPVLPLPLPSQARAGADLVPAGAEPLLDVELEAGDCLYLPRGFVHAAQTTDEPSVHLTVGILTTTLYDVLSDALSLAGQQVRFRDGLPIRPAGQLGAMLPGLLREAADWLAALDPSELEVLVQRRLRRSVPAEPLRFLAQYTAAQALEPDSPVRPRAGLVARVVEAGERVDVVLPDRRISLPAAAATSVRLALAGASSPAALAQEGLDVADGLVIVRRLLREGVVVPA